MGEDLLVVGGSLAGLTFALACARHGIRSQVLERVQGRHRNGGALRIDHELLRRVVSSDPDTDSIWASFPILSGVRQAASWYAVHGWLRRQAARRPEITLMDGMKVSEVSQDDECATVLTTEGKRIDAAVVVGADGYQSVVRRAINPDAAYGQHAGYVLWRGLIREDDLPPDTPWPPSEGGFRAMTASGYCLSAFPVAGMDGSLMPGKRLINFVWYDRTRTALFKEWRCLSDAGHVTGYLAKENVPASVRDELEIEARSIWPEPWLSIVLHALQKREVFGTPVAEYWPERLCRRRLAIIGDAAHVVSPVTGEGFRAGALDAEALAECLSKPLDPSRQNVSSALDLYESRRLRSVQNLVETSMKWSRAFMRSIPTKVMKN